MTRLTRRTALGLSFSALLVSPLPLHAGNTRVSANKKGQAIKGYDTHAYWTTGAAREGADAFTVDWNGATWRFATTEDATAFRADPAAYAPQFGGFCTRAMSLKKVVHGDPEVWRIYKGGLYLFARPKGAEVFDGEQEDMIAKATAHWHSLD